MILSVSRLARSSGVGRRKCWLGLRGVTSASARCPSISSEDRKVIFGSGLGICDGSSHLMDSIMKNQYMGSIGSGASLFSHLQGEIAHIIQIIDEGQLRYPRTEFVLPANL